MDGLLRAACVAEFAGVLKTISLLKGPLLFSHTLEYLLLFDREAQCRVFSFSIEAAESLAPFIMSGQNAQVFLSYARAARYRGNVYEGITMDSLAAKVCDSYLSEQTSRDPRATVSRTSLPCPDASIGGDGREGTGPRGTRRDGAADAHRS
ncbi:unnamed protein product [Prorocentrum cordatum]|uniref:Uncharacterized protein n=1 Tax=Prorocentrum cordatum TaxID=2364126 RepID=A0ABN9Q707_9DINO|nr:unnamed protein product [Polarella glacialis]